MILIVGDVLLILCHLVMGSMFSWINLDTEYTPPAIYQGIKAIGVGLYLYNTKRFRIPGLIAMYVGLDEMLVIHERTEEFFRAIAPRLTEMILVAAHSTGYRSVAWIVLLMPIMILLAIYGIKLMIQLPKTPRGVLAVSGGLFAIALVAEIVGTRSGVLPLTYHWLVAIEEGCEMIGMTNLLRLESAKKMTV